jgi:thymidine kinase
MLKALKEKPNQISELSRIECSDIDDSVDLSRKLISRLYDPKGKSERCHIDRPAKSQMTFDLQTILVQDQTFHLSNHAQEVTQLLALENISFWIFTAEKDFSSISQQINFAKVNKYIRMISFYCC